MGARAKVEGLPADVRTWLEQELIRRGFSGYEELASLLEGKGYQIKKSSVHRYGEKLERRVAAIKASTEAARLIAEAAPDEADERGAAVISLVQSQMFDILLLCGEAEAETDAAERIKLLSLASKGIADLTRASVAQKQRADQVGQKIADELKALKQAGLDAPTLDAVEQRISIYLPDNRRSP